MTIWLLGRKLDYTHIKGLLLVAIFPLFSARKKLSLGVKEQEFQISSLLPWTVGQNTQQKPHLAEQPSLWLSSRYYLYWEASICSCPSGTTPLLPHVNMSLEPGKLTDSCLHPPNSTPTFGSLLKGEMKRQAQRYEGTPNDYRQETSGIITRSTLGNLLSYPLHEQIRGATQRNHLTKYPFPHP